MKKLLAWLLVLGMLPCAGFAKEMKQPPRVGQNIRENMRPAYTEDAAGELAAEASAAPEIQIEEFTGDALIVTTEGLNESSERYSIEIHRPRVYSAANPALTAVVDSALEEIFSEAYSEVADTRLGCTNSSHAGWEGCMLREYAYLNNACVYGDLLMLTICHGYYDCGIGHNCTEWTDFYFSISKGTQIELKLRDLLDTANNPGAEDDFIALMREKFEQEGASASPSKMFNELNESDYGCSWGLMPSGIGMSFERLYYDNVPYSISMTYGELNGIIKPEFLPDGKLSGGNAMLSLNVPMEEYGDALAVYPMQDADYAMALDGQVHHIWVGKVFGYNNWELNGYCNYFYGYGTRDAVIELQANSYGNYCVTYLDGFGAHKVTLPGGTPEHAEWDIGLNENYSAPVQAVDMPELNLQTPEAPVLNVQEVPSAEEAVQPGLEILPAEPAVEAVMQESIGTYDGRLRVDESSYRTSNNPSVDGSCIVDGDLKSAWNSYDRISGEWLEISTANGEAYQIAGFRIASGYWKNSDVYKNNAKPKLLDVYCDDTYAGSFKLKDERDYQTFWFDAPMSASRVRFVVEEGYAGKKYDDCCVTEIELLGPKGMQLNSAALNDWGAAVQSAQEFVLGGGELEKGDYGLPVVGLQLILRDGFSLLDGAADGDFGSGTREAVKDLAAKMQDVLPECEDMEKGVVDAAFWRNMLAYMDRMN